MRGSSTAPVTATVDSSAFSDNAAIGGIHGGWGGAIYAEGVYPATQDAMQLAITDSTFTHNQGTGVGEGGAVGAITATISVSGSVFSDNGSANPGDTVIGGGIGVSDTNLTITTTAFSHNQFGAITAGPFSRSSAKTTITRSIFTGNETTFQGGAALNLNTTATVADSTLTSNSATGNTGEAAHPLGGGAVLNSGALTFINDTFADNSVGGTFRGSTIYNLHDDVHSGTITYRNTIIANGSDDANCYYEPSSVATDGGYNLDSGTSCGFSGANHSLNNTDPHLAALADNGGPTQTMALQVGSPAIDAANGAVCAAAPVNGIDQRGIARPQGPACDIGAFELVPTATTASGTPVGSVTFKDGSTTIGTGMLSGGYASFSTSSMKTGTHSVSAAYPAGHGFLGSASGAVTVIVGACEGGGGSGLDPNAPTTPHPLYETPTATLAPASTATPSVSENPASGGPALFALVGSGALLLLLLAGGSFFYIRRRNGGTF